MKCPKCGSTQNITKDSRYKKRAKGWIRKRKCITCGYTFRTVETVTPKSFESFEDYKTTDQMRINIERIERMSEKLHIKLAKD